MSGGFIPTVQTMLAVVPLSEVLLRQDLEKAIGDSTFRSPEASEVNWAQLDRALRGHFGKRKNKTDWEIEMILYMDVGRDV